MKKTLSIFLLFFSIYAFGQTNPINPQIKWGKGVKVRDVYGILQPMLGPNGTYHYFLRTRSPWKWYEYGCCYGGNFLYFAFRNVFAKEAIYMFTNDVDNNPISVKRIKTKNLNANANLLAGYSIDNQPKLIFSEYEKKLDEQYLSLFDVPLENKKNPILNKPLDENQNLSGREKSVYKVANSSNQNFISVLEIENEKEDTKQFYNLTIYDKNFTELSKKRFESDKKRRKIDRTNANVIVDDNGVATIIEVAVDKENAEGKRKNNYTFFMLNSQGISKEIFLDLLGYEVMYATVSGSEKDKSILFGYYYYKNKFGGSFTAAIDFNSSSVTNLNMLPLEKAKLKTIFNANKSRTKNTIMWLIDKGKFTLPDGSVYFVAEEQQITVTTTTNSSGGTSTSVSYINGDVFVSKINTKGELEWINIIAKEQIAKNAEGYYVSIHPFVNNNNLYVLFNDNLKNVDAKPDKKVQVMRNPEKSALVVAGLDKNGKPIPRKFITTSKGDKYVSIPTLVTSFSDRPNVLYIMGVSKRRNFPVSGRFRYRVGSIQL